MTPNGRSTTCGTRRSLLGGETLVDLAALQEVPWNFAATHGVPGAAPLRRAAVVGGDDGGDAGEDAAVPGFDRSGTVVAKLRMKTSRITRVARRHILPRLGRVEGGAALRVARNYIVREPVGSFARGLGLSPVSWDEASLRCWAFVQPLLRPLPAIPAVHVRYLGEEPHGALLSFPGDAPDQGDASAEVVADLWLAQGAPFVKRLEEPAAFVEYLRERLADAPTDWNLQEELGYCEIAVADPNAVNTLVDLRTRIERQLSRGDAPRCAADILARVMLVLAQYSIDEEHASLLLKNWAADVRASLGLDSGQTYS